MTSQDTELTFVRCPSCRSLVPAVATRCRMCGYSFESSAEAEDQSEANAQSKSRVRQRTISATREQLDELANTSSSPSAFAEPSGRTEDNADEVPPPYESEAEPISTIPENKFISRDFFASALQGSDSSEADDATTRVSFEPVSHDADEQFSKEETPVEASSVLESFSAAIRPAATSSEPGLGSGAGIAITKPDLFGDEEVEVAAQADEDVDTDFDDSRFDDGDDGEGDDEADESSGNDEPTPSKRKRRRRRRRRGASERIEVREAESVAEVVRDVPQVEELPVVEPSASPIKETLRSEEKTEMNGSPQHSAAPVAVSSPVQDGVLVGWMVSFSSDSRGKSEELRAGKFFLGRQRLRGHDMVIDAEGVSTPHCLVVVGEDRTVRVQDLMSERGTHVKRASSGHFEAISDAAKLEHGDTLKLGSYELVICLLPSR